MTCGHSAGGHLALWLAARPRIPAGMPGADPRVTPVAAVAQAGVCDLDRARRDDLGGGAVEGLLGPPDAARDAAASPAALAPLGVPSSSSTATRTTSSPSQSRDHASLDPDAELVELAGVDHFEVIEPASAAWVAVLDRLDVYLGGPVQASRCPLPPSARNCSQASLIRSAWPGVNIHMQESCE